MDIRRAGCRRGRELMFFSRFTSTTARMPARTKMHRMQSIRVQGLALLLGCTACSSSVIPTTPRDGAGSAGDGVVVQDRHQADAAPPGDLRPLDQSPPHDLELPIDGGDLDTRSDRRPLDHRTADRKRSDRGSDDRGVDGASQTDVEADGPPGGTDRTPPDAISPADSPADTADAVPGVFHECEVGDQRCDGITALLVCRDTEAGRRMVSESCATGAGCVRDTCRIGQCSDQCHLGEPGCELYDLATASVVLPEPEPSLHDRARLYDARLRRDMLPSGGVVNIIYSDDELTQPRSLTSFGDSAIWTGTLLAAEALRLMEDGSPDAARSVAGLVETLHLWFNVSGHAAYLARYVQSVSSPPPIVINTNCGIYFGRHCDYPYEGEVYDWHGDTSRDQYQGVMTGLALAYDASPDPVIRGLIRDDVVEVVEELMRQRVVPVEVIVNSLPPVRLNLNSRYLILNPSELTDGRVVIALDTGDIGGSAELHGVREFLPDMSTLVHQIPGLGWTPDIPRAGTAIMLGSFFLSAIHMTADDPAQSDRHQAIRAFYETHADEWLEIAGSWSYPKSCGTSYYATNIVFTPAYNLARLETDTLRRWRIRERLIPDTMWPEVEQHKNAYFGLITASHMDTPPESVLTMARRQLTLFPAPPKIDRAVDLTDRFDADPECNQPTARSSQAIDMDLRPPESFQWQNHPWKLVNTGTPRKVFPGVDYLIAYWIARHHAFLEDDRTGVCTRQAP